MDPNAMQEAAEAAGAGQVDTGEASPSSEGSTGGDAGDIWGDLALTFESDEVSSDGGQPTGEEVQTPAPAGKPEGAQPAPGSEGQKAEPPQGEGQAPASGEQPAAPKEEPETTAPPPPGQEEPPQAGPQPLSEEQFGQLREHFVNQLASETYALTPEQLEAFQTEGPQAVLPQLAARLHANIMEAVIPAVVQQFHTLLPEAIERQVSTREVETREETQFFSEWPELKDHYDKVMEFGQQMRAANPKMPADEFRQQLGRFAWIQLKLPMADLISKLEGNQQQAAPAQPSGQPQQVVDRMPQAPGGGMAPASPGGNPSGSGTPNRSQNVFTQLAEEFIQ